MPAEAGSGLAGEVAMLPRGYVIRVMSETIKKGNKVKTNFILPPMSAR